jgi:hypothetical protein
MWHAEKSGLQRLFLPIELKVLLIASEMLCSGFHLGLVVRQVSNPGAPVMAVSLRAGVEIGSNAGFIQL